MVADGLPRRLKAGSRRRLDRRETDAGIGSGSQHFRDRPRTLKDEVATDQRMLVVSLAARVVVAMKRVLEVGRMMARLGMMVRRRQVRRHHRDARPRQEQASQGYNRGERPKTMHPSILRWAAKRAQGEAVPKQAG